MAVSKNHDESNFPLPNSFTLDLKNKIFKEESKLESGQKFLLKNSRKKFGLFSLGNLRDNAFL